MDVVVDSSGTQWQSRYPYFGYLKKQRTIRVELLFKIQMSRKQLLFRDKEFADDFLAFMTIFVVKHHGRCTAENCKKTKVSITATDSNWEEEEKWPKRRTSKGNWNLFVPQEVALLVRLLPLVLERMSARDRRKWSKERRSLWEKVLWMRKLSTRCWRISDRFGENIPIKSGSLPNSTHRLHIYKTKQAAFRFIVKMDAEEVLLQKFHCDSHAVLQPRTNIFYTCVAAALEWRSKDQTLSLLVIITFVQVFERYITSDEVIGVGKGDFGHCRLQLLRGSQTTITFQE